MKLIRLVLVAIMLLLVGQVGAQELTPEQTRFFEAKIRPVLVKDCYGCHSAKAGQARGGLLVDTREGLADGGDSGPSIVPGDLDESMLWSAINYEDYRMPPGGRLSANVISDFKKWIEMGAPDPRVRKIVEVNTSITKEDIEAGREFWSFKPPANFDVPSVKKVSWPKTDVDRFVLSALEASSLAPSKDAKPETILRRLTFDLVGLPPTREQISFFAKEYKRDEDRAISQMVDQLLATPQYGERWGRHWLDVARFAESTGKELNLTYPHAWRYRDYVIDSFNADKPYDRFVQEQIAGDLLPAKTDKQWADNLVATGFLAMGPKTLTEQNPRQFNLDLVDEQIDVSTRVVLGVSVACARCHDHKFDPIPQTDYYAIAGIFQSTATHYGTLDTQQNRRPSDLIVSPISDPSPFQKKVSKTEIAALKDQLSELREELRELQLARRRARQGTNGNENFNLRRFAQVSSQVASLEDRLRSYDEKGQPLTYVMGVQPKDQPIDARLLVRGEFDKPGQTVKRGFVQVIGSEHPEIKRKSTGRLELAKWMTDPANPLTARVMVNRIWQHLFGNGIVRTPENFGATGMRPSHPELLDFLAIKFIEDGWSVKAMIKELVASRIYRTDSQYQAKAFRVDPENRLLWRYEPRQLTAEAIRDSILSLSGNLDLKRPHASMVAQAGQTIVREGQLLPINEFGDVTRRMQGNRTMTNDRDRLRAGAQSLRQLGQLRDKYRIETPSNSRSVYLPILRDNLPRALEVFDFAESTMVVGKRESSNTAPQGLYMLNNEFVVKQSELMAKRLMDESSDVRTQVETAFLLAYGRKATGREIDACQEFYRNFEVSEGSSQTRNNRNRFSRFQRNPYASQSTAQQKKMAAICQAIIASAEFRYLN